jgi:hypothetical protein
MIRVDIGASEGVLLWAAAGIFSTGLFGLAGALVFWTGSRRLPMAVAGGFASAGAYATLWLIGTDVVRHLLS